MFTCHSSPAATVFYPTLQILSGGQKTVAAGGGRGTNHADDAGGDLVGQDEESIDDPNQPGAEVEVAVV